MNRIKTLEQIKDPSARKVLKYAIRSKNLIDNLIEDLSKLLVPRSLVKELCGIDFLKDFLDKPLTILQTKLCKVNNLIIFMYSNEDKIYSDEEIEKLLDEMDDILYSEENPNKNE